MFRASQHPSSGALKTVTATSGIGHNTGTANSFQRGLLRTGVSSLTPVSSQADHQQTRTPNTHTDDIHMRPPTA